MLNFEDSAAKPFLCIYHSNCADGFTAAWVIRKWAQEKHEGRAVDFFPGVYQQTPPDVAGRDVLIVDFSYKRAVLETMGGIARSITILDHHKTAYEDLFGFTKEHYSDERRPDEMAMDLEAFVAYAEKNKVFPIRALFDMKRSGAGLTWDWCFPGVPRPELLNHIEDRDLWKFALRSTREIQASVFSYPYDFKTWDWLMSCDLALLATEGAAIERKHFKDIRELLTVVKRTMRFHPDHVVPVANVPYTLTSDAGHIMAKGSGTVTQPEFPFAACYWDTPAGRVFSLRSAEGGADVSVIAKQYGGGGHAHASGFTVGYHRMEEFEVKEPAKELHVGQGEVGVE